MITKKNKGEVSTRLIVTLAVVGVLVVAAVPLGFYIWPAIKKAFEEPGPREGVVRTAAELKALKPFKLPDGCSVRLGISSDECYQGGCIMVYALIEGNASVINESPKGRNNLGPLSYNMRRKGKRILDAQIDIMSPAREVAGFYYNTVSAPIIGNGEYVIEFYDWENKTIANVNFTARRPAPHPWQDFEYMQVKNNQFEITDICNRSMAVPYLKSEFKGEAAPAVLPRVPFDSASGKTGDLKLSRAGNGFRLNSDVVFINPFNRKMLARFWINGRPVASNPDKLVELLKQSKRLRVFGSLYFEFGLDYGAGSVKRGDRIRMQFMYTPSYKYIYNRGRYVGLRPLITPKPNPGIRISNTLEFTCP